MKRVVKDVIETKIEDEITRIEKSWQRTSHDITYNVKSDLCKKNIRIGENP